MKLNKRVTAFAVVGALAATFALTGPVTFAHAASTTSVADYMVTNSITACDQSTLNTIIAAADDGDTIDLDGQVCTLSGQVTVSSGIQLTNSQDSNDGTIHGGGIVLNATSSTNYITVTADDVSLTGLTIVSGPDAAGGGSVVYAGTSVSSLLVESNRLVLSGTTGAAILFDGAITVSADIKNNIITDTDAPDLATGAISNLIKISVKGTTQSDVTISGNEFPDGPWVVIAPSGNIKSTITNNIFNGPGASVYNDSGQGAFIHTFYSDGYDPEVTVTGNTFDFKGHHLGWEAVSVSLAENLHAFSGNHILNAYLAQATDWVPGTPTPTDGFPFLYVSTAYHGSQDWDPTTQDLSGNTIDGHAVIFVGTDHFFQSSSGNAIGGSAFFNYVARTVFYNKNLPDYAIQAHWDVDSSWVDSTPGDSSGIILAAAPVLQGFVFDGWSSNPNSCDRQHANLFNPGSKEDFGSDLTLYACWLAGPISINYDGNAVGAQNVPDPSTGVTGSVTLSDQIPTLAGYTFEAWSNTSESCDFDHYANQFHPSQTVDLPDGYTLYACWIGNPITISYDANLPESAVTAGLDAQNMPDPTDGVTGSVTLSDKIPTLEGYVFGGWSNVSWSCDASAVNIFQPDTEYAFTTDYTVFACWTPGPIVISYRPATPQPAFDSHVPVVGLPRPTVGVPGVISVASRAPRLFGYTFLGWCNIANGTPLAPDSGTCQNPDGAQGNIWAPGASTDTLIGINYLPLYAMWQSEPVTVHFDANLPDGVDASVDVPADITTDAGTFSIVIPLGSDPVLDNYSFDGWCNYQSNTCDTGNPFQAGSTVIYYPGTDNTLWAMWTFVPAPELSVVTKASLDSKGDVPQLGDTVSMTFTITNVGNVPLDNANVKSIAFTYGVDTAWNPVNNPTKTDCVLGDDDPVALTIGATDSSIQLDVGDVMTCTASFKLDQRDINTVGKLSVDGTGRADYNGQEYTADPGDVVPIPQQSGLSLSGQASATSVKVGDDITFTYTIGNTGNVSLTDFVFEDSELNGGDPSCVLNNSGHEFVLGDGGSTLNPGEEVTCTVVYTATSDDVANGISSMPKVTASTVVPMTNPVANSKDEVEATLDDAITVTVAPADQPDVCQSDPTADGCQNPGDGPAETGGFVVSGGAGVTAIILVLCGLSAGAVVLRRRQLAG